jgi:predicted methyltransferase
METVSMRAVIMSTLAAALVASVAAPALLAKPMAPPAALQAAVASTARAEANRARDKYRHPAETLAFFGIKATHTVVEIWPGGGWYSEILAPYLKAKGKLILAPPQRGTEGVTKMVAGKPDMFSKAAIANFPVAFGGTGVAPGTADAVLTFRNVHNFKMGSGTPDDSDYTATAFKEMYAMLKPGGILGIEDHRLNEDADAARERSSGYVKVSTVRAAAEAAGFVFAGSSEVNANSKDTKDYPKGVWTLPPRFAEKDVDRDRYAAIGESDRMTLRFVKPKK